MELVGKVSKLESWTTVYEEAAKEGTCPVDYSKVFRSKAEDPTAEWREWVAKRIVKRLIAVEKVKCLDVGCCMGTDLRELVKIFEAYEKKDVSFCGLDLLEAHLTEARKNLPNATFVQGDATVLPYEDSEFDSVQCTRLLIHIPDFNKAVDEMIRVLKPGGLGTFVEGDFHTNVVTTNDRMIENICAQRDEYITQLTKNPYIGTDLYRILLSHPSVEHVELTGYSFVVSDPSSLGMDKSMLELLVEKGQLSQESLEYYVNNIGNVARRGDYVQSSTIFVITVIKKQ